MILANRDLNHYFNNEVQMKRDETTELKRIVLPVVEKLLEHIHQQDARFGGKPLGVGSSFQGLKTNQADEFDFNILLHGIGKLYWAPGEKRYYDFDKILDTDNMDTIPDVQLKSTRVPLPDPPAGYTYIKTGNKEDCRPVWRNSHDLEFQKDLIPFLVKKTFKELLQQAIRDLELRDNLRLGRKVHGPALTLRIPCHVGDVTEVSVDFAPTYPAEISFPSHVKWPRYMVQWPSSAKIKTIKELGINFTAKKPFYWLYSYAICEKELMKEIDKDGGCRKKSHRILKRLREQYWSKSSSKPKISSYHLKNLLFWECEKYPSSWNWNQDKLAERVESMTRQLLQCISEQRLKQYFDSEVNLLKVKDSNEREALENERLKIVEFLANPTRFLITKKLS